MRPWLLIMLFTLAHIASFGTAEDTVPDGRLTEPSDADVIDEDPPELQMGEDTGLVAVPEPNVAASVASEEVGLSNMRVKRRYGKGGRSGGAKSGSFWKLWGSTSKDSTRRGSTRRGSSSGQTSSTGRISIGFHWIYFALA